MLDWSNPPFAKWFVGGELNVAYNCLDRHVEAGHGDKVAIHWEGEPGDTRTITYADLHELICQAANALTELGVAAGDRVAIYLPMIPEAAVAMLACARIGATHSVVFGGFSVDALSGRIQDAERQAGDHRRRRLPARQAVGAQADRRRGGRPVPDDRARAGRPPHRRRTWPGARRTCGGTRPSRRPAPEHEAAAVRRRAPAVHPLHLRHDRQAEGHPAHHRRLPDPGVVHPPRGLRPQAGDRRLLVHRRHRLGDRPLVHRLRPAVQRRHPGDVRGHAGHPPQGTVLGASSTSTR